MSDDFLVKLGEIDMGVYYYQRDNVYTGYLVKTGWVDPLRILGSFEPIFQEYDKIRVPFQELNVGDAKNLSHDDLKKMTNNFSEENLIQQVRHGRLFRGFIDDGKGVQEVTVKTWDFVFHGDMKTYETYPRKFRDEIVLLARSEMKSHPFVVKLFGFCFEKMLAVVYDLKFNTPLCDSIKSAEFGWKERMKVAIDYALLLKTLSEKQFDVCCNGALDVMLDKEYSIKLMNFRVFAFPPSLGIYNSETTSDEPIDVEKEAVRELGLLLLELVTKKERKWEDLSQPSEYIAGINRNSLVHESFEIDGDTGTKITQLIKSCVHPKHVDRPPMNTVFEELVSIFDYRPPVSDSPPWLIPSRKRSHSLSYMAYPDDHDA